MRVVATLFLASAALLGQVVPGRYVVELSAPAMGTLARPGTGSTLASARRAGINSQQRTARIWIEQRKGRVISVLSGVMNALVVDLADGAATLAGAPGVAHVYSVRRAYPVLDRALPLHTVPQAWAAVGGMEHAGAGVKIGMLDTGISANHPGFQDSSLAVPDGYPLFSRPENKAVTNNKIIVARDYAEFYSLGNQPDTAADHHGHGTATAMCAAGVLTQAPFGRISGVAPKAWLGIYKITPLSSDGASEDAIAKALDDALADGMDVVNISFDSPFVTPLENDLAATSIQRATELGMIVVVAAGNGGPDLATMEDVGSVPSAISVGASDSDRSLGAGVTLPGTAPYPAFTSSSPLPSQPLSGPLAELSQLGAGASLCGPLPPGSAAGHILLGTAGFCAYETQINIASAAGAAALILSSPSPLLAPTRIIAGQAKLPTVMVSFQDAAAMRAALGPNQDVMATITFGGLSFSLDPKGLYNFSSRGPTYSYQIKPDLSATGYVYTAAQRIDPQGAIFDASGYVTASGTSFSSPIVAGAAAVLKAARPGLSVNDYRSLLINSTAPLMLRSGVVERVQRTGAGVLDLAAALHDNVAAFPTSFSFGAGSGDLDEMRRLTLTNIGKKADTFTITAAPYDDAPPLLFSTDPRGTGAVKLLTLAMEAGQSKTVYVIWRFQDLPAGEYQGLISVQPSANARPAFLPYWHAIPSGIPAADTIISSVPSQLAAGQSLTLYFRVVDSQGIPVLNPDALRFSGTVITGQGSMSGLSLSDKYPNLVYTTFTLGPDPGTNIFRLSFANLLPRTFSVTGTRP
jgi:subtilisin family serine protease